MGQTVRQLTVMDASYLYLETAEVPMHVGSLSIFRLPETNRGDFFEGLKALIGRRLHLAPMLAWKLASTPLDIHRPSWIEDDQFDIDRHVFLIMKHFFSGSSFIFISSTILTTY